MTKTQKRRSAVLCVMLLAAAAIGEAQVVTTGTITGRAVDAKDLVLPGVAVTITSPAMIGGPRTTVTDEQGTYRFSLLVPGTYTVSFLLQGFNTLTINDVIVTTGATMTINGVMQVGGIEEMLIVTSDAPTIDLEAATIGVNWSSRNLEVLPSGKSLPALVNQIPGLYATQYDVGASTMGGTAAPPARTYGRAGGNVTSYDGVVWDQTFGDFGSYDQIQVVTAAKGAEAMNPGASFNFVIKSGGNQFRGSALVAWQDDSFQSNNVTQELLDRGLSPTSNQYTRYNDFKMELGGPILRDRVWFYGSYTDSYVGQYISGFVSEATGQPAVFFTRLYGPTLKFTVQPQRAMKFDFTNQFARKWQPYRGADQFKPLEATESQDYWGAISSLKWTYFPSSTISVDAAINRSGYWWETGAWTGDVRRNDLTTSQLRGANIEIYRRPEKWQSNASVSWFPEIAGRNHELKTGYLGWNDFNHTDNYGYPNQQLYRYRSLASDGTDYFLRPDSVQVFDYPNFVESGVNYASWFVNDRITLTQKITLNAGIRFDHYSSYLPAQGNPGTGPFAVENMYPERHDFPVYDNWSPRLSFAYDLLGDGRVAIRASYGRYAGAGSGLGAAPGPTASSVNPNAVITRTYNNWDGSTPYVPDEANLSGTSGGGGTQVLDPNLRAPVTDEFTLGTEMGTRAYQLRLNVVHKRDRGGSKVLDLAMPYEAYTDVRSAVDPGRDNVVGTADDGTIFAWSVPRSYPGFGTVNNFTTNVEDGEAEARYWAYEVTFSKQYSKGWSLLVSGTADLAQIENRYPTNPNQALYSYELPSWNYGVKVNGTYDLPFGITYASTFASQSGEYYGRSVQMRNALNSTVTVLAEGRVGRYDWVSLWDNRLVKSFRVNSHHVLEASIDFYNTLNASTVLSQINVNGPDYLKPSAGSSSAATATAILPPRIFRLGVKWRF